ncbi:hypothetical protein Ahia01_000787700 [Argonauta hians]
MSVVPLTAAATAMDCDSPSGAVTAADHHQPPPAALEVSTAQQPVAWKLIEPQGLVEIITNIVEKVLIIDSRSFLEFNTCHIRHSVNVCCSKLVKRRLQQDKVHIKDLLTQTCHIDADENAEIIVYDQCTEEPSYLTGDNFLVVLLHKLSAAYKSVTLLKGGFLVFQAMHPSLCESKSNKCTSLTSLSQPCLPITNVGPTRILHFLYLGSQRDAMSQDIIQVNGISYILNVTTTCKQPAFIQENHFLRIPINDNYFDKMLPYFHDAFQFLDKVREANGCVLIHCLAGISRSPTLAIAYVMRHLNMSSDDAYRYVKAKRPTISPNFNFLGQLLEYEKQLREDQEKAKKLSETSGRTIDMSPRGGQFAMDLCSSPVSPVPKVHRNCGSLAPALCQPASRQHQPAAAAAAVGLSDQPSTAPPPAPPSPPPSLPLLPTPPPPLPLLSPTAPVMVVENPDSVTSIVSTRDSIDSPSTGPTATNTTNAATSTNTNTITTTIITTNINTTITTTTTPIINASPTSTSASSSIIKDCSKLTVPAPAVHHHHHHHPAPPCRPQTFTSLPFNPCVATAAATTSTTPPSSSSSNSTATTTATCPFPHTLSLSPTAALAKLNFNNATTPVETMEILETVTVENQIQIHQFPTTSLDKLSFTPCFAKDEADTLAGGAGGGGGHHNNSGQGLDKDSSSSDSTITTNTTNTTTTTTSSSVVVSTTTTITPTTINTTTTTVPPSCMTARPRNTAVKRPKSSSSSSSSSSSCCSSSTCTSDSSTSSSSSDSKFIEPLSPCSTTSGSSTSSSAVTSPTTANSSKVILRSRENRAKRPLVRPNSIAFSTYPTFDLGSDCQESPGSSSTTSQDDTSEAYLLHNGKKSKPSESGGGHWPYGRYSERQVYKQIAAAMESAMVRTHVFESSRKSRSLDDILTSEEDTSELNCSPLDKLPRRCGADIYSKGIFDNLTCRIRGSSDSYQSSSSISSSGSHSSLHGSLEIIQVS